MTDRTLRSTEALVDAGLIPAGMAEALAPVAARYAVAITPAMARLVTPGDPDDPIAAQFLPTTAELEDTPDERADPIGDAVHEKVPGVIHRYPDRALLKIVSACPVYCRFCFRREMVGPAQPALTGAALDAALDYIAATPAIWEVILTGGDPFILSPRRVAALTERLAAIPHVKVLRWHTRVPMVDPGRITPAFVRALRDPDVATWVAIHANHPREFTPEARTALARLADAGVALVSQSVLLKGINDSVETLDTLMRSFVENRVKPYYLHHADLAPGTSHQRTTLAAGQALTTALRGRLSGLAQPTYVLDIPGGFGKVPVGRSWLTCQSCDEDAWLVTDPGGQTHRYPPAP